MNLPRLEVLGTKVARRVLVMFMAGAAAPVAVMAILSFVAINGQLRNQSELRLSQLTGVQTQSILGQLTGVTSVLRSAASLLPESGLPAAAGQGPRLPVLPPGLEGMVLERGGERYAVAGSVGRLPTLDARQRDRIAAGGSLMFSGRAADGVEPRVLIAVPVDGDGLLWGSIVGDSVWGPSVTLADDPSIEDVCILDSQSRPLYCRGGSDSDLARRVIPPAERTRNSGETRVAGEGGARLVAWRDVYLRAAFDAPSWTVAVSQPASSLYAAGDVFVYNLLLTILIGLSAALLVTHVLVRRTMEPLRDLTAGTQKLANHDLQTRVEVRSDDEFGALASSFNDMAARLGMQFNQLEARRAIDHAALTASDQASAAEALLHGLGSAFPDSSRALALLDRDHAGAVTVYALDGAGGLRRAVHIDEAEVTLESLVGGGMRFVERSTEVPPALRAPLSDGLVRLPLLLLPLKSRGVSIGSVAVSAASVTQGRIDMARAQDLADQAALALEKLRLDQEVASMSWETLRALANAIDAKSAWTTGHSERVTRLSLVMGAELALDKEDLNTVHRGGLLHDIGKIGVPAEILDYNGVLDADMRAVMEKHPEAGAHILAPIRAFKPIIPIVLYHHERWDGSGYPEGLVGEDIPWLARLVAVADVFDAMVSARPYRPALDPEVVLEHIRARRGSDFDPIMVQALEGVMRGGWRPHDATTDPAMSPAR